MSHRASRCVRSSVGVMATIVVLGAALHAAIGHAQEAPKIKEVPDAPFVSVDGKENFMHYCAVCHGADGKGNGPAAPALKGPVPDLTTYAARHGGKFNTTAVERMIAGSDRMPAAHGTVTMPMWGPIFRQDRPRKSVTMLRIRNLAAYIESIQQK